MAAKNRRKKEKSCKGKRRYATYGEAHDAAAYLNKRGGEWLIPYRCEYCGGYHAGHAPAKVRKAILSRPKAKPSTKLIPWGKHL